MSSEHGLIDEDKLVSSDATLAFNIKQDYHSGECVLCDKTFEGMTNEEVSHSPYVFCLTISRAILGLYISSLLQEVMA